MTVLLPQRWRELEGEDILVSGSDASPSPRSLAEKPTESAYRYTCGSHILWSREATDCGIVVGKFRGQVGLSGKAVTDARRAWTPAGAV